MDVPATVSDGLTTNQNATGLSVYQRANALATSILAFKARRERDTAESARFEKYSRDFPIGRAVDHVLSDHPALCQPSTSAGLASTMALSARLVKELGRQHSAAAAVAGFDWVRGRFGGDTDAAVYEAAVTACAVNFAPREALEVFGRMQEDGKRADVRVCNMIVAACCNAGFVDVAVEAYEMMVESGVVPNTFTYAALLQGCDFKGRGLADVAMVMFSKLLEQQGDAPDALKTQLLNVVVSAMRRAPDMEEALKAFVGLQHLRLEDNVAVFNALLDSIAQAREWEKALHVFKHMTDIAVPANTNTYNALINACVNAGKVSEAFHVFEWMVEGRGAPGPVPTNAATFEALLRGCHQTCMLERALEVLSWMRGAGLETSATAYQEILETIDIVKLWDSKVFEHNSSTEAALRQSRKARRLRHHRVAREDGDDDDGASLHNAVLPNELRPAPFDGTRMLYLRNERERLEDDMLAALRLGGSSWVPVSMQPPLAGAAAPWTSEIARPGSSKPGSVNGALLAMVQRQRSLVRSGAPPEVAKAGAEQAGRKAGPWRQMPPIESHVLPHSQRFEVRNLHPLIAAPNAQLEHVTGYDMHATRDWRKLPATGRQRLRAIACKQPYLGHARLFKQVALEARTDDRLLSPDRDPRTSYRISAERALSPGPRSALS